MTQTWKGGSALGPSRVRGGPGSTFGGSEMVLLMAGVRCKSTAEAPKEEEGEEGSGGLRKLSRKEQREMSRKYNERRALYNKEVARLRKQYADEYAERQRLKRLQEEEERRRRTRRRLENQRRKNLKMARSAIRQEQRRLEGVARFEAHLAEQQQRREEREARFARARQLIVDDLEREAPYWLMTHEEVDKALSQEGEQELWGRRGGLVGAPPPSFFYEPNDEDDEGEYFDPTVEDGIPRSDMDFWRYECHPWAMERTLQSPRELLFQDLIDFAYHERNIDPTYWTEQRVAHLKLVEEKAKLRALVLHHGRLAILLQQREFMRHQAEDHSENPAEIVKKKKALSMSSPSLALMARVDLLEQEGSRILLADPTKFFKFEDAVGFEGAEATNDEADDAAASATAYEGGTLGKPSGLRDHLRDVQPFGTPYPFLMGRELMPDTRTAREKKRDERERRLLAAVEEEEEEETVEEAISSDPDIAIPSTGDEINYETIASEKSTFDLEWEKEMVSTASAAGRDDDEEDYASTPSEYRLTEDDFQWIIQQLEKRIALLEEMKQAQESNAKFGGFQEQYNMGFTGSEQQDDAFATLEKLGFNTTAIKVTFSTLTDEQREALAALEEQDYMTAPLSTTNKESVEEKIRMTLRRSVPGLSDEQLDSLTAFELSILSNEDARRALSPDA